MIDESFSNKVSPLSGVTVVEIGHSVAAPYAGQILADLGAYVVKVENPNGGDDARHWGPPFWHGAASAFQSLNRNKTSVSIDLKDSGDLRLLQELIAKSDIVIQNMRPGLVDRYEIGADQMRKVNDRLIYCNLGAFGNKGPLKNSTGYDPLVQAFSGIMSVTGEHGRPPVRVGPSIIDQGSGMWSVIGILSALLHRGSSGKGCVVDTSLFETALAWMTIPIASYLASGNIPGKSGSETPMLAPYRAYRSADRYVVIAAGNNNLFARLSGALGHPEWASDYRFINNSDRIKNRVILNKLIEDVVLDHPSDYWVKKLEEVGVPCAPAQSVDEVVSHPQTSAMNMLQPTLGGEMKLVSTPISFDGERHRIEKSPPFLGDGDIQEIISRMKCFAD